MHYVVVTQSNISLRYELEEGPTRFIRSQLSAFSVARARSDVAYRVLRQSVLSQARFDNYILAIKG